MAVIDTVGLTKYYGAALGVVDLAGIRRRLGRRWAYRLRETITIGSGADWRLLLELLAKQYGRYAA